MWIVGSSIVRGAWVYLKGKKTDTNIGDSTVWWQGYGGLLVRSLKRKFKLLQNINPSQPKIIIVHCGGNDIGMVNTVTLMNRYQAAMIELLGNFPNTKFVFSQILPRTNWRYSSKSKAMNNSRRRINSFVRNQAWPRGALYLKHNVTKHHLKTDGVHLNDTGNQLFVEKLAACIRALKLDPTIAEM